MPKPSETSWLVFLLLTTWDSGISVSSSFFFLRFFSFASSMARVDWTCDLARTPSSTAFSDALLESDNSTLRITFEANDRTETWHSVWYRIAKSNQKAQTEQLAMVGIWDSSFDANSNLENFGILLLWSWSSVLIAEKYFPELICSIALLNKWMISWHSTKRLIAPWILCFINWNS